MLLVIRSESPLTILQPMQQLTVKLNRHQGSLFYLFVFLACIFSIGKKQVAHSWQQWNHRIPFCSSKLLSNIICLFFSFLGIIGYDMALLQPPTFQREGGQFIHPPSLTLHWIQQGS